MNDSQNTALYEIIADNLEEMIISGGIRNDRKFPSENTLATSFGVSRPVIREAIKLLKERGIISLRQGAASVISEPGIETITNPVRRIIQTKNITHENVYEVRMMMELTSIRLACRNADENGIAELTRINDEMEKASGNESLRTALDIEFHTKIAEMSLNPLLGIFIESLSTLIYSTIKPSLSAVNANVGGVSMHRKLIDALRSGNEERCVALMRTHLLLSMQNYETAIRL